MIETWKQPVARPALEKFSGPRNTGYDTKTRAKILTKWQKNNRLRTIPGAEAAYGGGLQVFAEFSRACITDFLL
jgi:hypothetical protein